MKKNGLIDFPYLPPTMASNIEDSVYYWWWAYLKRHEGYIRTCGANGEGECSALYEHFGDVRGDDFAAWWKEPAPFNDQRRPAWGGQEKYRGTYLFANLEKKYPFVRVKQPLPDEAYTDPSVLILQVPLDEPDADLIKRFKAYIDTFKSRLNGDEVEDEGFDEDKNLVFKTRRGVRAARSSEARYPVFGQPNTEALKKTLMVYDLRKNSDMTLWQIANELDQCKGYYNLNEADDRNTLSVIASRYVKKAKAMINNAAAGRFPDVN